MATSSLPRFSIIVLGYNQEKTIEAAIRSVLEQNYDGEMEIILSDDCSTDSTYSIMEDCAKRYKGPIRIVLNRSEKNLGRGKHLEQAISLASYEWIMRQDGDDYSFPYRCHVYAQAIDANPDALLIRSKTTPVEFDVGESFSRPNFEKQPEHINTLPFHDVPSKSVWLGAYLILRKKFFEDIREWPITPSYEDDLHGLYAWLLGNIYDIDVSTYYYGVHANNVSTISSKTMFASISSVIEGEKKIQKMKRELLDVKKIGLQFCQNLLSPQNTINTIRSKKELLLEIDMRQKFIDEIEEDLQWWNRSFTFRFKNKKPGYLGLIRSLPIKLYAISMVALFKLIKIKRFIFSKN